MESLNQAHTVELLSAMGTREAGSNAMMYAFVTVKGHNGLVQAHYCI